MTSSHSQLFKLREKLGLSQRLLSEKSSISRGRLRRLEGRAFEEATYGELKRIADALGVEVSQLFQNGDSLPNGTYVGKAGESVFKLEEPSSGYRLISFVPPNPEIFTGRLSLAAKKCIPCGKAPSAKMVFIQMLLGGLRVTTGGDCHKLSEGDSILFRGVTPYSIENPFYRDAIAFFLTAPLFTIRDSLSVKT